MAEYGSPMGVEVPGNTRRERPKAGTADASTVHQKLAEYEQRARGEAKRPAAAPPGGRRLKGMWAVDEAVRKAETGE